MKRLLTLLVVCAVTAAATAHAEPLRVFIRAGKKTHGPNAHEHERFLTDWKQLLADRGMKADGALGWPTPEQFQNTDVIIVHAQSGGDATEEQKANLAEFTKRGGGLVVIHAAAVSNDPPWWKSLVGGSWVPNVTKWKEGPMDLYFTENQQLGGGHPITKGASNFYLDDEIYYDLDLAPEVRVLATAYTPKVREGKKTAEGGKAHIYDIQPQMWTYEKDKYRAVVCIPGHLYGTFSLPNFRALLLRSIAWAGQRPNIDEYCQREELAALTYPPGGPQRPEDTLKALEIHPDFTLKLVAAEPLISKPMNFDWDAQGRLWVAETPEYPNGRRGMRPDYRGKEWKDHGGVDPEPGQQERKAIDKISILTDTNGDGVMDRKDIFYEGLELVTGLVFYKDGVIVTQAPDILWLRDTNGDGQADKVETLFSGLGTGDTHAVINNPRWGWDGWIYATHGYSGSDKVLNAKGETMPKIGSGVVRFRPGGSAIEQYSSKGGNTWGLEITGDNRVMWTQPTSGTILNHTVLPEYALARGKIGNTASFNNVIASPKTFPAMSWDQQAYRQIDHVGDFTATAGCVVYDGGSWPAEYNGDYFTTEPTINIIHHSRLKPAGSSYSGYKLPGREDTEFIRSKDMWWRPIEVRVGPDGAVYVGDFYNQAVIHNDTRGPDHNKVNAAVRPDRDHYFGRIWRLDHKDAQKLTVPDLSQASLADLARALDHPSRAVRLLASRLIAEKTTDYPVGNAPVFPTREAAAAITPLLSSKNAETRIAALWTLRSAGRMMDEAVLAALKDPEASVRRNAALVSEASGTSTATAAGIAALLGDPDAQVRLAALRALAAGEVTSPAARAVVAAWPKLDDDFQRSAAIGAAAKDPVATISAALGSPEDVSLTSLVGPLVLGIGEKNDVTAASYLVVQLAERPVGADSLKRSVLDALGKSLKDAPPMTSQLSSALGKLLASGASGSALPLAARWDKAGTLKAEVTRLTTALLARLNDSTTSEADRLTTAQSLLGLRQANAEALPAVIKTALGKASPALQRQLIVALGETGEASVGPALSAAFGHLPPEAQGAAFEVLLRRAEWSLALLGGVKAGKMDVQVIGPANVARLRTHPNREVSQRANAMLDELLGPALKAKNDAIAKLTPEVEKSGDAAKGKVLYTAACAICHKLDNLGVDIGPALTGMGAHGPAELLAHIVDPNREVDPSFLAWNIETKNGQSYAGIIARENPTSVVLKSLAGEQEVKVSDIKSRVNTGRSLMPEGLEALGAEGLRDILTFICGSAGQHFRMVDLKGAFTADTRQGLYNSQAAKGDTLSFKKFGPVTFAGIPFNIVDAAKNTSGNNVVVLKGGPGKSFSKTLPQRVEARLGGFQANRLHFLGGVTGWGFNGSGAATDDVLKITVVYSDGQKEEIVCRNGVEFADYRPRVDVPGSKATDLVSQHQLRFFSKQLKRTAPIEKLILESFDTNAAPTTVAITAELADPNAPSLPKTAAEAPKPVTINATAAVTVTADDAGFVPQFNDAVPQPPATRPASGPRVLLVGGGSSHDFVKFFGATDKATLSPHVGWVDFTQNANGVPAILDRVDVLVWSANQPVSAATRKALIDYANSGKGIVALHPGTWYAWKNFPDWNLQVVGGGTRGHDKLGPYTVKVTNPAHPVTKGVTPSFEITDELYNYIADPAATPIEVLAEATSPANGKTFPQVFVVKHPKSRIIGLTLGHDARAHDLPEYQALLKNAVNWVGGK